MWPKRPASVVIDSVTYLLTISSSDIDNIATSLYKIMFRLLPFMKLLGSGTYIWFKYYGVQVWCSVLFLASNIIIVWHEQLRFGARYELCCRLIY